MAAATGAVSLQQNRAHMAFQVIHRHQRLAEGKRKSLCRVSPTPTSSEPTRPGPQVTPTASHIRKRQPGAFEGFAYDWHDITEVFARKTSSGTTPPPYLRCTSICEATTLEKDVAARLATIAARRFVAGGFNP